MACARRSLTTNLSTHLARRFHPSLAHIAHNDDDRRRAQTRKLPPFPPLPSRSGASASPFVRSFAAGFFSRGSLLGVSLPLGVDPCLLRRYSTNPERPEEEVLSSGSLETASDAVAAVTPPAPFPGEVAAAAADSFPLVAGLQHLIDGVHSFTGLNWWACIALTTVLIRGATIPLLLNQLKDTYKLTAMRPELEQLKEEVANSTDPQSMQEGRKKVKALFQKHGVHPFSPLKGLFVQGPIFVSFFFAISNMVEKVPSFKGGGALWFTDLTTPDAQYILPGLTALTFLATVELNMQEGMEGNPVAKTMKKFSRGLAFLTVPFTAHFPQAIFCYWITSNLFSLLYGFLLRRPPVRKLLNLPDIVPQDTLQVQPTFLGGSNSNASTTSPVATKEPEESKPFERRISSSSVMSQRIRVLEKAVKARNMK